MFAGCHAGPRCSFRSNKPSRSWGRYRHAVRRLPPLRWTDRSGHLVGDADAVGAGSRIVDPQRRRWGRGLARCGHRRVNWRGQHARQGLHHRRPSRVGARVDSPRFVAHARVNRRRDSRSICRLDEAVRLTFSPTSESGLNTVRWHRRSVVRVRVAGRRPVRCRRRRRRVPGRLASTASVTRR